MRSALSAIACALVGFATWLGFSPRSVACAHAPKSSASAHDSGDVDPKARLVDVSRERPGRPWQDAAIEKAKVVLVDLRGMAGENPAVLVFADGRVVFRRGTEQAYASYVLPAREKSRLLRAILESPLARADHAYGERSGADAPGRQILFRRSGKTITLTALGMSEPWCGEGPPSSSQDPQTRGATPGMHFGRWVDIPDAFVEACRLLEALRRDPRARLWVPPAR